MKRFAMIVKSVLTILAVVPFSLIGVLVVATVSKPEPKETASGGKSHHEGKHAAHSPSWTTNGRLVVIERPDSIISRTITSRMFGCWQTLGDTNGQNGGSLGRNSLEEETVMTKPGSDIAFTPSAKGVQPRLGSRQHYAHMEECGGWSDMITPELRDFLRERDSCYFATARKDGRPYIQHRGGPKSFLNVLDGHTLAFPDFKGNRQFLSVGNLTGNNQAFLFTRDYATQTRINIWGRAEVIEDDPELQAQLTVPGYKGKPEWAIRYRVEAWDVY